MSGSSGGMSGISVGAGLSFESVHYVSTHLPAPIFFRLA